MDRQDMLLFTPIKIKNLELKNRLVMPAMATNFADEEGFVTPRMIDYYQERAKGGVGLIIVEGAIVEHRGKIFHNNLCIYDEEHIPGLARLAKAIHTFEAKALIQLGHGGRECSPKVTKMRPVGPSPISPSMTRLGDKSLEEKPKELTLEEVEELIEKFARSACMAKEAGFDGIELICGHRALVEQFLLSHANKRQDKYGGSIENRARFACNIVSRVRDQVGHNFIISCRVPATEYPPGGYGKEEIIRFLHMLKEAGTDIFNVSVVVSTEVVNLIPMAFPRGYFVPLAEWVKGFIAAPTITFGRINNPFLAERILQENRADLIAMGRPLIADPELPNKAKSGKWDDIRTCIACNKGCADRVYAQYPITCSLNVEVGRERELKIKPAKQSQKVMIIGGGPAGLEAARVATLRGHQVTLWDKDKELGGQLQLAKIPPHKEEIESVIHYFSTQLNKLGVNIRLGSEVNKEILEQERPDIVLIASGAHPLLPPIPGIETNNVFLAKDILLGQEVGPKVAVVGGGLVGVETAEYLAERGKEVVIIEMLAKIATDLGPIARNFQKRRLAEKGIRILTKAQAIEIKDKSVVINKEGSFTSVEVDSIVIAVGYQPNKEPWEYLPEIVPTYIIGDCIEARDLMAAIHDGSLIARRI
jgi:2,4-dienoyl-CoA reductase-like NADH-dependent reductase (Old Yellow Enzyme family)/thioredoxin reductase